MAKWHREYGGLALQMVGYTFVFGAMLSGGFDIYYQTQNVRAISEDLAGQLCAPECANITTWEDVETAHERYKQILSDATIQNSNDTNVGLIEDGLIAIGGSLTAIGGVVLYKSKNNS